MQKRQVIGLLMGGLAVCAAPGISLAQSGYPNAPIKIVVPYPAGGGTDYFARLVAPGMGEALGQTVIVENKPGASGMIGAGMVAKQLPADGYTILLGDMTTYAVNSSMFDKVAYDVQKDFTPVTMTAKFDFMLVVNPQVLPVNNVAELIAAAAKSPSGLNYASPSIGTTHHLAMEMFAKQTGARLVPITYKGGGPAVTDLLGGQVSLMFLDRASARQHIQSGKLRAIAVAGHKRIAAFPDVPTLAESGVKDFNVEGWQGFSVRAGTPEPIVKAIAAAYAKVISSPDIVRKLADAGIDPVAGTSDQFASYIQAETVRWKALIRERGIKAE